MILSRQEEKIMPGKFSGLTDEEWEIPGPFFPDSSEPKPGQPHASFRKVINTILWVLISGARWADIPDGKEFGRRSTSHRWLGIWKSDGTWKKAEAHILGIAENAGLIDWERGSADSSFSAGKGGGEGIGYGFKGKGVSLHTMTDGNGSPLSVISTGADGGEREQIGPLIESVKILTGKRGRPNRRPAALQADKGYDSRSLRNELRRRGVTPMIPRREWPGRKKPRGRPPKKPVDRWKAERTFAWLQRKFRRLTVRWERREKYWEGFILAAICFYWLKIILG